VVGVDGGGGEPRDGMDQGVLGADGDRVGRDDGQVRVHDDVGLGAQRVPDPAHLDAADRAHPATWARAASPASIAAGSTASIRRR
jgi:hypothetical protein